ncbi:MAG: sulfatase [Planctomycetota bacterium]|nr:sulfatase [Planctomycetota bacterium]
MSIRPCLWPLTPLLAMACSQPAAPPPPRNLVLVVVDTLRADHTGLGGYERDTTPFLDTLAAAEGSAVFGRALSSAPWTKPSVASLLTGLDPRAHGVTQHHERLHSGHLTLAEHFAAAGYQTAGFQTNMLLASVFGYDQGFEVWGEQHLATHATSTGDALNAAAERWLTTERDPERPFFLYVHHYEPHFDYLESGERWYPDYPGPLTGDESMDELVGAKDKLRAEELRFLESRYDAEIRLQDRMLGDLWDALAASDAAADTLFVVTADHGEEFLEHGDLSHEFKLFEELVHVPLLVHDPRGSRAPLAGLGAAELATPVSLTDLPKSLFGLLDPAALDPAVARGFPGTSFLAKGGEASASLRRAPLLGHVTYQDAEGVERSRDMLVEGDLKLMRQEAGAGFPAFVRLFDLATDPGELHDLAAERPDLVASLTARLEAELARRLAEGSPDELPAEYVDLSPEDLAKLKALGYL